MILKLPKKKKTVDKKKSLPNKVDMNKIRKCERIVKGQWEDVLFDKLERGDVYRMFEPDGTPVDNGEICVCLDNPYFTTELKTWGVKSAQFDRRLLVEEFKLPKDLDNVEAD